MCLSGLMGVGIWARGTEKGRVLLVKKGRSCFFSRCSPFICVNLSEDVYQISFEAEYHTTIILYVYLCYWLDQ